MMKGFAIGCMFKQEEMTLEPANSLDGILMDQRRINTQFTAGIAIGV